MIDQPFRIVGIVLNTVSGRGVPGLRVEAWDRDARLHDSLGSAATDVEGKFTIGFNESAFFDKDSQDNLPDVFFKIYYGRNLIHMTQDQPIRNMPPGEIEVKLEVELFRELMDGGAPGQGPTTQSGSSVEVALHEFGQSVAVTVASVQRELSRYPNAIGTYVLDEIDLSIPVQVRVDMFGQVLTTVAQGDITNQAVGNIHMRLRPVPGLAAPPPEIADQPLDMLGLPREVIEQLKARRIFSVEDLLRVSSTPTGRLNLETELMPFVNLGSVISSASLLTMPGVPQAIGVALVHLGYTSVEGFANMDSDRLASELAEFLRQRVTADDVWYWQKQVREASQIALPSKASGFQRPPADQTP